MRKATVLDNPLLELREPAPASSVSTQFVVFNLFGDYILPHGGSIWTNNLLRLLELLDIGERAARSTLSLSLGMGDFIDELARVVE